MLSNIVFIGNIASPLAIERFSMLKNQAINDIYFYDRSNIIIYDHNFNIIVKGKNKHFFHITSFLYLIFFIFKYRINILHFHGVSVQLLALLALIPSLKIVATPQGSDINQNYKGKNKIFTSILLKKADKITVKSLAMKKRVNEITYNNKINILNWGLNNVFYENNPLNKGENIYILSPRSNKNNYNIVTIFEAVKEIKSYYSNVKFVYVSLHKDNDKLLDLSIADEIYYNLMPQEMKKLYLKSDFMISIPTNDGFSTSIMEALVCECLPIISNINSYDELPSGYQDVFKINQPYSENLVSILKELINNINNVRNNSKVRKNKYAIAYSKESQSLILKKIYKNL